jgi:hypothetical protein
LNLKTTRESGGPFEGKFYSHDNWNQVLELGTNHPEYEHQMKTIGYLAKGNFYALMNDILEMIYPDPVMYHPKMSKRQLKEYVQEINTI